MIQATSSSWPSCLHGLRGITTVFALLQMIFFLKQIIFFKSWESTDNHGASKIAHKLKPPSQLQALSLNATLPFMPANVDQILPLCTRDELLNGRWEQAHYDHPPYISKTTHLQCHNETYYKKHGFDTFKWVINEPRQCKFKAWNASVFCNLIQHATVSIVGDSLSWEMYSSLLQLLGTRVHQTDQHRSKSEAVNIVLRGCFPRTRFVFRNDPRLKNLKDSITKNFPIVLVLNRGPHYVNDSELVRGMQETIGVLYEWREKCKFFGLSCHLYWRTSVPGHPLCHRTDHEQYVQYFSMPDNDLDRIESWIQDRNNYDNITLMYHWFDYQKQNNIILEMLQKSGLNATILDAYYLNVRRVDGHRPPTDCLHNCYPGKMDVLNQLLQHFLEIERSPQDNKNMQNILNESEKHRYQNYKMPSPQRVF